MLTANVDIVAGGIILDHFDVRNEGRSREGPFEKVMAQKGVLGHPPLQCGFESIDVVNPFPGESAFVKEILINVRSRRCIGLDPAGAGKEPLVDRPVLAIGQGRADTRLQDAVAAGNALRAGVEPGTVQGMGNLADHLRNRATQKAGIGVQSDDVADINRQMTADHGIAGVSRPTQQAVQLSEFAAFAFPAHPHALGRVA